MIFKCRNCGANTVWSPEKDSMCCPHCDSIDSEEAVKGADMFQCAACGAPMQPKQYDSATKCEHCGAYTIFEERISGEYQPHLILPFKVGKQKAKDLIKQEFGKKLFLPSSFLKESYLDKMEGDYIPFFLFDFDCHYRFSAKGKKIRRWTTGDTEYTETSIFQIFRDMDVDFSRIPTDASLAMPDGEMDLLEPYNYGEMTGFEPKYMSGFLGEIYSVSKETLEPRAKQKARNDAGALMRSSIIGYDSVMPEMDDCQCMTKAENYALLPVWNYIYRFKGKDYFFRLNGQTGKLVGKAPISIGKMTGYAATLFGCIVAIGALINGILGVI